MTGGEYAFPKSVEPELHAFALPGGSKPAPDPGRFDKSSHSIACDYKSRRCLMVYQTDDPTNKGKFVWHIQTAVSCPT